MEKPKLIEDLGMLRPTEKSKYKIRFGVFECPYCFKHFKTSFNNIKNEHSTSCGCNQKRLVSIRRKKHGLSKTKLFEVYNNMRARCYNKNNAGYNTYGKRGIKICDEWLNDFKAFYEWALRSGYSEKLTIDRINNDGDYEPNNCRWITIADNSQNTRLLNSRNTSGYRGVTYHKRFKIWFTRVKSNKVEYYLGYFKSPIDAAIAYNNWVIEHKTLHPLNIIPNV